MKRLLKAVAVMALLAAPCARGNGEGAIVSRTARPGGSLQEALAKVEAQCPRDYPDKSRPLPEHGGLSAKSEGELLQLLSHWNPAMRSAAGRELATRGDAAMPALKKALDSGNWTVRAGAVLALTECVRHQFRNWQQYAPGTDDSAKAVGKIRASHGALADTMVALLKDSQAGVRSAALGFLITLRLERKDIVSAVLERCTDEDDFIAQNAMIMLEKTFGVASLEAQQVIPALKQAMGSPLPRGRGHVVRMIGRMEEPQQRQFIPELIAHLDWQPDRDTMFGAGGQEEALRLLTKFKVKQLVPRIPKLMNKIMRGPGLFEAGLECAVEFGSDAKVILPELRAQISKLEEELANAGRERDKVWRRDRIEKIRKAVQRVESI